MTWPVKKMEEVAKIEMGQSPSSSSYNDKGVGLPFFQGKADFGEVYPVPRQYCTEPNRIAEAGDVLISVRAPVGNINLANEKSCIGRGLAALRADQTKLNQALLYYFLKKNENNWSRLSVGSTFMAIRGDHLKNYKIPVPPLEIQKKIIERLDTIQEAQKLNNRLIEKIDEFFQSLLHRELDSNKKDWKVRKLGDVMHPQYGYTAAAEDSGEYRLIRITDIANDGMVRNENKKYVSLDNEIAKQYLLKDGDLLLARTGATFGKILYFSDNEPSIFASFLIRLNPDISIVDPRYLWFFSRSSSYWRQARSLMTGSGQPQFNANKITKLKIVLPPLATQKQIIAKLDVVQQYKAQLLTQKAKLKELFDSVLAKSMKGEMDE
jgi:type I restriction enzyme S subunit